LPWNADSNVTHNACYSHHKRTVDRKVDLAKSSRNVTALLE